MALTASERAQLVRDREAGLTVREISERRDVPASTVQRVVEKVKLPKAHLQVEDLGPSFAVVVDVEGLDLEQVKLAVYRALTARGFEVEVDGAK